MKLLNLSGGGTKIVGIYSAAKVLLNDRQYKPDVITGVSAGAYLALPLAMGLFAETNQLLEEMNLNTMFDPSPVKANGKLTLGAIKRVAFGEYWLGDQRKSLELVREVITPERFENYQHGYETIDGMVIRKQYPDVYVSSIDFRSGDRRLVNLKHCKYEEALDFILASGSIPVYTKGVDTGQQLLFDGGVRNHIASVPTIELLLSSGKEVRQSVSVFARPQDYRIEEPVGWIPADISTSLTRTLDIMNMEISKKDEREELMLGRLHNFKVTQVFLPDVLQGVYDTDKARLSAYRLAGYFAGTRAILV